MIAARAFDVLNCLVDIGAREAARTTTAGRTQLSPLPSFTVQGEIATMRSSAHGGERERVGSNQNPACGTGFLPGAAGTRQRRNGG